MTSSVVLSPEGDGGPGGQPRAAGFLSAGIMTV
jgi:hypothetical protein